MSIAEPITFEAGTDQEFARWVTEVMGGGERLKRCIQCGQCSAVCPVSDSMDYTPRRLMRLAREGFKKEVLTSNTPWLCASCYGCTVVCPQNIKLTDVMYSLKQRAIQEGIYPHNIPGPVVAKTFASTAGSRGRVSEIWLMVTVFLKTNLLKAFGMTNLGLGLLRTRRLVLKRESIRRRRELKTLLEAVRASEPVKTNEEAKTL